MEEIGKLLAQVHRRVERYSEKAKGALDDAKRDTIAELLGHTDTIIKLTVAARKDMTPETVAAVYDTVEGSLSDYHAAIAVIGDSSIIRRATSNLTTADEVNLQLIASQASEAINEYLAVDLRSSVLADTRDMDTQTVVTYIKTAPIGICAATLIADRGLRKHVAAGALEDAKNNALGVSERTLDTNLPPIQPLTEPATEDALAASWGVPNFAATRVIVIRHPPTQRFNWNALLIKNTAKGKYGGLTSEVLRRYATVIDKPSGVSADTATTTAVDGESAYIVETYDGVHYHAWNGGAECPVDVVRHFVGGYYDRDRVYHRIMEESIVKRMNDPFAQSVASQYADSKTEYTGDTILKAARMLLLSRVADAAPTSRAQYLKVALDRDGNTDLLMQRAFTQVSASLRETLHRHSSVMAFLKIFEKHVNAKAPTDAEFAKYPNPKSLVDIAIGATLDATVPEAKRVKTFSTLDKTLADYVRDANREYI